MSHLSLNEIVELIILLSLLFAPKPTKSTKPWNNAAPFVKTGFLTATENDQFSIVHGSWMIWSCHTISSPQWASKEVLWKFGLFSISSDDHLLLNLGHWANPSVLLMAELRRLSYCNCVSLQLLWMSQLPLKQVIELIVLSLLVAPKPTKPWDNAAPIVTTGFLWLLKVTNWGYCISIQWFWSCQANSPSRWDIFVRIWEGGDCTECVCVSLQSLWMSHLPLNPGVLLHHLLQQVSYGRTKDEVLLNVCLPSFALDEPRAL